MLVVFVGGVGAVAKQANRPVKLGGRTSGRTLGAKPGRAKGASPGSGGIGRKSGGGGRGGSWPLKAWNATGAPKTAETSLWGASAVVAGKTAGGLSRGGWWLTRRSGRAGRWFMGRALIPFDRWLERKRAGLESAANMDARSSSTPESVEPTAPPKPSEPSWLTKKREAAYQRYADLRRSAGLPLTPVQVARELDVDQDEAENQGRAWEERFQRENGDKFDLPTPPEPARTPPPVFVRPNKSSKGASMNRSTASGAVPATLAPHLNHINDFEPESDADLLNFMGAEVAGKAAEAEAYMELFDRCVSGHGLDPQAMQGVSDYSEAIAESAEAMKRAHQQFVSVYDAIIEAANNGTVMPHNGRFFSGESAA
jgi:hypothetical protein